MFGNGKNGVVQVGNAQMDYVCFGESDRPLIFLPGLGDGLRTVKGMAKAMSVSYSKFAPHYRVYVFSRKEPLEEGCSVRDMARDQKAAMDALGITNADVMGVSMGGMIAQYLAADYPEVVGKLVLAVTLTHSWEGAEEAMDRWIAFARAGDYMGLMMDTAERMYSEKYVEKFRVLLPLLARIDRPKDFSRFLIQAAACREHDSREVVGQIRCPTLVIGGDSDRIAGPHAAQELAEGIPGSQLYVYKGRGHGLYEEARDFNGRVLKFLQGNAPKT